MDAAGRAQGREQRASIGTPMRAGLNTGVSMSAGTTQRLVGTVTVGLGRRSGLPVVSRAMARRPGLTSEPPRLVGASRQPGRGAEPRAPRRAPPALPILALVTLLVRAVSAGGRTGSSRARSALDPG